MQEFTLNTFNHKALLQLDPLVTKGYSLVVSQQFLASLRFKDDPEEEEREFLLKLSTKYNKTYLAQVVVDVFSEEDLFFHYRAELDPLTFKGLQEEQGLSYPFAKLPEMVVQLLNSAEQGQTKIVLSLQSDKSMRLIFWQQANYKQISLLALDAAVPETTTSYEMVAYRYGFLKAEIDKMSGRILDVREMLRLKNPQMLLQFDQF